MNPKLEIIDMTVEGEGIGKEDGRVYFIEGAVHGDLVTIKETYEKKNIIFGKVDEYLNKNPDRAIPFCKYFEDCDGCSLQNLNYDAQMNLKKNSVLHIIKRIGDEDIQNVDIISSEKPSHYRNKVELKCKNGRIGYYSRKTHELVDIDTCPIALENINEAIPQIQKILEDIYGEKPLENGILKNITIRSNGKDLQLTLTTSKDKFRESNELFPSLTKITNLVELYHSVNKSPRHTGIRNPKRIYQKEVFYDYIEDLKFKLSPESFFQVNHYNTVKLYEEARNQMELTGEERILDLYCGLGSTTLFYAQKAKKVVGVEIIQKAIENAKENAVLNNIHNVEFFCGKSEDLVEKILKDQEFDIIAVDPPRKGLDTQVIQQIGKSEINKVQYISCNPSTMARDIKALKEYGFELKKVVACDMFSQTMHVETVVLMSRVDK